MMFTTLSYWTIACLILGTLFFAPFIMGFFSSNKFDVEGKTVLLTGASQGMGLAVAKQLSAKGANILAVARNVSKLEEALIEIKASAKDPSTQRFQYLSADLAEPESARRVITEAIAWNEGSPPDVVWCIAGSSYPNFWIDTPVSKLRSQMDINFWGAVELAHGILNEWLSPAALEKKMGQKHLIFTSSVVAFYPVAGYGPYSPAKAALRNLSDTLVQEVLLYGGGEAVKIHTVFPGTITSPGFEVENRTKPDITKELEDTDPVQSPEEVATAAIRGLEKGEYLITVNWLGSAMRAQAWGGMRRNNWILETILTWITSWGWMIVQPMLDGQVRTYGKKHGHPSTYPKKE